MNSQKILQQRPVLNVASNKSTFSSPTKYRSPFILGVLLLSLLILAKSYVMFGTKQTESPTPPLSQPSPTAVPTIHPTTDWETYINKFDNYSIKYPQEWFLYPATAEGNGADITNSDISTYNLVPSPENSDYVRVNINVFNNEQGLFLDNWLRENYKGTVYGPSNILFTLNVLSIITREETNSDFLQLGEMRVLAFYIPHNKKIYRIIAFPPNTKHKEALTEILSTFTFLDEVQDDETITWNTYANNEFNYSLNYPSNYFYQIWDSDNDFKDIHYISFIAEKYKNTRQPPEIGLIIYKNPSNLSLREFLDQNSSTSYDEIFDKIIEFKETTIINIPALSFVEESPAWSIKTPTIIFEKNGLIFAIFYTQKSNNDDDIGVKYNQMLSSFKFL
ncbi:hypothetical protein HYT02_06085 [Candidatus Gottesmanbacteria bacterium]|nr:hypothetical protein [Candidatus Gottesmanbacteria bacterium]